MRVFWRIVSCTCKIASRLWVSMWLRDACSDVLKLRPNQLPDSRRFEYRA